MEPLPKPRLRGWFHLGMAPFVQLAGLVLIVADYYAEAITRSLRQEAGVASWVIGEVVPGDQTVVWA